MTHSADTGARENTPTVAEMVERLTRLSRNITQPLGDRRTLQQAAALLTAQAQEICKLRGENWHIEAHERLDEVMREYRAKAEARAEAAEARASELERQITEMRADHEAHFANKVVMRLEAFEALASRPDPVKLVDRERVADLIAHHYREIHRVIASGMHEGKAIEAAADAIIASLSAVDVKRVAEVLELISIADGSPLLAEEASKLLSDLKGDGA